MAVALPPGEITVTLHCARDLKDADWFGKQDPYVKFKCGTTEYRSNTHHQGGTNPVWNQNFVIKVDQETHLDFEVWDEDAGKEDDFLGRGQVDLVAVRTAASRREQLEAPIFRRVSKKQQGHLKLTLSFLPYAAAAGTRALPKAQAEPVPLEVATLPAGSAAAAAAALKERTSLPAGVVPPGGAHDPHPSYEPTCGLIQPRPDQMLPCHRSSNNGRASGTGFTEAPAGAAAGAGAPLPHAADPHAAGAPAPSGYAPYPPPPAPHQAPPGAPPPGGAPPPAAAGQPPSSHPGAAHPPQAPPGAAPPAGYSQPPAGYGAPPPAGYGAPPPPQQQPAPGGYPPPPAPSGYPPAPGAYPPQYAAPSGYPGYPPPAYPSYPPQPAPGGYPGYPPPAAYPPSYPPAPYGAPPAAGSYPPPAAYPGYGAPPPPAYGGAPPPAGYPPPYPHA